MLLWNIVMYQANIALHPPSSYSSSMEMEAASFSKTLILLYILLTPSVHFSALKMEEQFSLKYFYPFVKTASHPKRHNLNHKYNHRLAGSCVSFEWMKSLPSLENLNVIEHCTRITKLLISVTLVMPKNPSIFQRIFIILNLKFIKEI
jgi:hypothetical protein